MNDNKGIEQLRKLAEGIRVCMFCTSLEQAPFRTRPMSTQSVDDQGNIWFLSDKESDKNMEIKQDSHVQLLYADAGNAHYLNVFGKASIYTDKQLIEEMWNPIAKTWFTEGKDDPAVSVIRVQPEEGYYWDTKNGKIVSMIKIAIGAITGTTMDDSKEGKISI